MIAKWRLSCVRRGAGGTSSNFFHSVSIKVTAHIHGLERSMTRERFTLFEIVSKVKLNDLEVKIGIHRSWLRQNFSQTIFLTIRCRWLADTAMSRKRLRPARSSSPIKRKIIASCTAFVSKLVDNLVAPIRNAFKLPGCHASGGMTKARIRRCVSRIFCC